jgi:ABC-type multidrug transport system fused ATPase/permease subunit
MRGAEGVSQEHARGWQAGRLARLGSGGAGDRLGFRLVVGLLWRCVGLLQPVRQHVVRLVAAVSLVFLAALPLVLIFLDTFWTRVLQGEPLTGVEAAFFRLDPARFAAGPLAPDARHAVLARLVAFGIPIGVVLVAVALGLAYYQIWILQRVNQVLRVDLLERIQSLSLRFHAESRVGDAIYRLYQDSAMVTQLIDVLFLQPLQVGGRFLAGLVVVAFFEPRLALVLLLLWPPALLLGLHFSRRLRIGFRAAREAASALTSRIQETLSGVKVIKAYGAEGWEQARFERDSRAAFDAAFAVRTRFAVFKVLVFWIVGVALIGASAWAALLALGGRELFGQLVMTALGFHVWTLGLWNSFKGQFGGAASQVRSLMSLWGRTQDVAIGLDRVFAILDLEPEVRDAPDAMELAGVKRGVAFRDVRFRYQPDRPALEGATLEAPVGSVVAVVGPTGSGKSTLVALLLRLFDPDTGSIEIDGVDLRRFRVASLRAKIAIALQENLLFGATIRENIRYAVPHASDAAVRAAARVACADEFVEKLPEGYESELGERGTKLSTGQRQRLSIARAVLKDAPILILDEPTASLDAETELRVLRNLAAWGRGRVIFLVTHRLSTIRRADRVAVLREGRVVEFGAHDALLRIPGGAYRALVEAEELGGGAARAAGAR